MIFKNVEDIFDMMLWAFGSSKKMEGGGLPLMSTFAFLTIVAGQLQGSGFSEQEPAFLSPLENATVAQGRDVHFTCTVNHLGNYKVAWIKSDTKTILAIHTHMVTLNPRLSVTHNGHNTWKLYIVNVEPKDSGTYMCQINTDPMKSQMGHLSVVVPPDIADDDGSQASTHEGGAVELKCSATGVPPPNISWRRAESARNIIFRDDSGKEIDSMESFAGSTLSLRGLQRSDMGSYLCIAANGIPPTQSRKYEVSVHFKPVLRVISPVVLRAVDMQISLECVVEAAPRSLNIWQRGRSAAGGKLLNGSKYIISEQQRNEYTIIMNLTIVRLKKSDFGEYLCSASNGFGSAEGIITLKETPQKTTTTTTTTTTTSTTTTTRRPTTSTTTKLPKRQLKKNPERNQNSIETRQAELNNPYNTYNLFSAYGTQNNSHIENAQKERQKVRPSGPPRVTLLHNEATFLSKPVWLLLLSLTNFV